MSTTLKPGMIELMPKHKSSICNKKNSHKKKKKTFTTTKPWDKEKKRKCTTESRTGTMSNQDTSRTPKTTTKLKMNRTLNGTKLNLSFSKNKKLRTKQSKPLPAVMLPQSNWKPPLHRNPTKTHSLKIQAVYMMVLCFKLTITSTMPMMSFQSSPRKSSHKLSTSELKRSTSTSREKNSKRSMMNEAPARPKV